MPYLVRVLLLLITSVFTLGCGASTPVRVGGQVAPGFQEVREEFERNFTERGERGAAVAVYHHGRKVVDLWGGERNRAHDAWEKNTLVPVYYTTKGIAALTLAMAHSRGWLDYDARVASYWPEFAQNGKEAITVRQLLSHEAGLVLLDETIDYATVADLDALAKVLARQRPRWEPGSRHGYHLSTLGFYMNELFRRVDPEHRSIGRFLQDEITQPLGAEFYIGVPSSLAVSRVAHVETTSPLGGMAHLSDPPFGILTRLLSPWSVMTQTFAIPSGYDVNDPAWWKVEMPSGNGIGTARGLARIYSAFAVGGKELGISAATFDELTAPPRRPPNGWRDEVLGTESYYGLGVIKPSPSIDWASSPRAFGMPGAGGSFAFADPDRKLGYAYVMNKMGYHLNDDPREKALRDATYRAIARNP